MPIHIKENKDKAKQCLLKIRITILVELWLEICSQITWRKRTKSLQKYLGSISYTEQWGVLDETKTAPNQESGDLPLTSYLWLGNLCDFGPEFPHLSRNTVGLKDSTESKDTVIPILRLWIWSSVIAVIWFWDPCKSLFLFLKGFFFFFSCGPFLKPLLNLLQYCLFLCLVFWLWGMWKS